MGAAFLDSLDIANMAVQLCGGDAIASPTEDSKNNKEASFAYDKDRRSELRRNNWVFAIRKVALRPVDTDTMLLQPNAWSSTVTYMKGAIVSDANGVAWISLIPQNFNNSPGGNNEKWDAYFGPATIAAYDADTTYWAGELVYVRNAPGTAPIYTIYQSRVSANSSVPGTAEAWSATTQYNDNAVVSYLGSQWNSLIPVNYGNTPVTGPLAYDAASTYASGETVTASDNLIYSSVASGNVGHDPVTDAGVHWTNTGVINAWHIAPVAVSSNDWLPIAASMAGLSFSYPIGTGPSSQMATRNVYRLPFGFLKTAPQDPKAGSSSFLGAPSGLQYSEWDREGNYLVSTGSDASPIILRFIADVTKVTDMDDMFCKGLACTLAASICEPITQSQTKLQTIASEYKLFMGEARTANLIEAGPIEPPEDDYITCRL